MKQYTYPELVHMEVTEFNAVYDEAIIEERLQGTALNSTDTSSIALIKNEMRRRLNHETPDEDLMHGGA
jgi:hypothetical protein